MDISHQKLAGNYLFLAGGEVAAKLATFLAFAYLGRVAGPEGMGYVEFAAALFFCAALVVVLGFDPYGAREFAKSPARREERVRPRGSGRMHMSPRSQASTR